MIVKNKQTPAHRQDLTDIKIFKNYKKLSIFAGISLVNNYL
jgi:hypothetical protein